MKKYLSYILSIAIVILLLCIPLGCCVIWSVTKDNRWLIYTAGGALVFFIAYRPLSKWRQNARQNTQIDEFGNSKRKRYENLSQKERDAIDLQKTADMERLVGSAALKRLTKPGSKNPQKDLDKLIGLAVVKQKVTEMAAKMEFDKQERKHRRGKDISQFDSGHHAVYFGPPGTGKAQPLYSKVLTPNGFVKMGDIKVGDEIISATNQIASVLGVYPQGAKDIYELTLDDGSTCRCCGEHLWKVQTHEDRQNNQYRTIMLQEMINNLYTNCSARQYNYSIDSVPAIDFQPKELSIPPYMLGLLLRDEINDNTLHKVALQYLSTMNLTVENQNKVNNYINYIKQQLKRLNLMNGMLFIPQIYLRASAEQRRLLLQGLTENTVRANQGYTELNTTSFELCSNIMELVRSLGGYVKYEAKTESENPQYRLFIFDRAEVQPAKRYITDIRHVGKEECQCIYISDPSHLYITDNYIVTHNTTIARIMTGFLYRYGYIKENKCVEVDGNFLKAGPETATKTTMIIRQAFNGVLFIDEAYSLIQGDEYGQEAIATLIKQMEDNRGRFVLIMAGYTNEMRALLRSNPGFQSRIKEYLYFEDYNDQDMCTIFKAMAKSKGYELDFGAEQNLIQRIQNERPLRSFGNARTARSILDEALEKHAYHFIAHRLPEEQRHVILAQDIETRPRTI